jgi:hypothetical protein
MSLEQLQFRGLHEQITSGAGENRTRSAPKAYETFVVRAIQAYGFAIGQKFRATLKINVPSLEPGLSQ